MKARQERFVAEYLVDLNATQAAIRAGYSAKTARSQGQRLLTNADIQAAIQAAMGERQRRTGVTQDEVVEALAGIAFAEAGDDSDAVLKYSNKLKALELLGKHLGMFTDRVEQTGESTIRVVMDEEMRELAE